MTWTAASARPPCHVAAPGGRPGECRTGRRGFPHEKAPPWRKHGGARASRRRRRPHARPGARALARAEGSVASAAVLWATAASVTLPCLAALMTMRLVADDRLSGRLDLLLSAPIYERDYLLGRFIGAFAHLGLALLAYLVVPLFLLPLCEIKKSIAALAISSVM